MLIFRNKASFREFRDHISPSQSIGFVPTMGALHQGHGSLAERSVAENDITIASIFVNPTQFGPNEDLDAYPKTLEADCKLLESLGVTAVFAPNSDQIYSKSPAQIIFSLRDLDKSLCGASREGHFNGVIQVVSILFHIVQPNRAYFGLKDFQQCMIIRHMVKELHFPIEIVPCPIVREPDGLALSSRNVYLDKEERKQAVFLNKTLKKIQNQVDRFHNVDDVKAFVREEIKKYSIAKLDYFEIFRGDDLGEIQKLDAKDAPHAFMAVHYGRTRLIDNMALFV